MANAAGAASSVWKGNKWNFFKEMHNGAWDNIRDVGFGKGEYVGAAIGGALGWGAVGGATEWAQGGSFWGGAMGAALPGAAAGAGARAVKIGARGQTWSKATWTGADGVWDSYESKAVKALRDLKMDVDKTMFAKSPHRKTWGV